MPTTLKPIEPSPSPISGKWAPEGWYPVHPDALPGTWNAYRPLVLRALMAGDGSYHERDVMFALLAGKWRLFAHGDPATSICIVEIVDLPRQRKCMVRYVVGELAVFLETLPLLEEFARDQKCNAIEAYARNGWPRKLPGWRQKFVILQKEL